MAEATTTEGITKVSNDIKDKAKISCLKVQRNMGNLTPEVLEMCRSHVDEMLQISTQELANRPDKAGRLAEKAKRLAKVAEELKSNTNILALVSTFADDYVEILKWNKLHAAKLLPSSATRAHREVDMALLSKFIHGEGAGHICDLIFYYGHKKIDNWTPTK